MAAPRQDYDVNKPVRVMDENELEALLASTPGKAVSQKTGQIAKALTDDGLETNHCVATLTVEVLMALEGAAKVNRMPAEGFLRHVRSISSVSSVEEADSMLKRSIQKGGTCSVPTLVAGSSPAIVNKYIDDHSSNFYLLDAGVSTTLSKLAKDGDIAIDVGAHSPIADAHLYTFVRQTADAVCMGYVKASSHLARSGMLAMQDMKQRMVQTDSSVLEAKERAFKKCRYGEAVELPRSLYYLSKVWPQWELMYASAKIELPTLSPTAVKASIDCLIGHESFSSLRSETSAIWISNNKNQANDQTMM